jgi:hypothetical protein
MPGGIMASSDNRPRPRGVDEGALEADPADVAAQRQESDPHLEPDIDDEGMPLEAEPADVAEQRRRAVWRDLTSVGEPIPMEADPADVADQQRDVVIDDDSQEP